ncbi:MAG: zinc metallopeptidase [Eubacteriales bacterium]|nr:zinc metallopeptidase [Eubacteriales bacterium]
MYYFYDPTYILVIIGVILSLWASSNVNSAINKYRKIASSSGLTAAEAAKEILHANGIYNVTIKMISGASSDYYSPSTKELCLLQENYNSTSIASIGIAAHECGHAIQDATEYLPLTIQRHIAPVCSFGSTAGFYIAIAGMFLSFDFIIELGIILFALGVGITILLLPIEYNASNRALAILENNNMMTRSELAGAKKVLRAAGLTYVAAAASSILSLLRLIMITNRRRN